MSQTSLLNCVVLNTSNYTGIRWQFTRILLYLKLVHEKARGNFTYKKPKNYIFYYTQLSVVVHSFQTIEFCGLFFSVSPICCQTYYFYYKEICIRTFSTPFYNTVKNILKASCNFPKDFIFPGKIYLFKINNRNTKKVVKYVQC